MPRAHRGVSGIRLHLTLLYHNKVSSRSSTMLIQCGSLECTCMILYMDLEEIQVVSNLRNLWLAPAVCLSVFLLLSILDTGHFRPYWTLATFAHT